MLRGAVVAFAGICVAGSVLTSVPALAGDMDGEEARRFVIGKMFSYQCFEGTRGAGRVFADGSVVGTVQFRGEGPVRRAFLPANTLQVKGQNVCASVSGMPFSPCFNLTKTADNAFRGAISGLGFAYCDFTRQGGRLRIAERARENNRPLALRPSLAEARN
ncbi:MAG: hypothetical protein JOZ70_13950 [Pseudolabrys sp.]|nr:hypothetical protein [Pseudolabrys sp.]